MTFTSVLRLPALRGPLPGTGDDALAAAGFLRLWPGLPASFQEASAPGASAPRGPWLTPAGLPLDERGAAACLEDERRLAEAVLSGIPAGALGVDEARGARRRDEGAARASFAADGDAERAAAAEREAARLRIRRNAQRMLLRCWLQEERLAELAALGAACSAGPLDGLLEDGERLPGLPDGLGAAFAPEADAALAPPWRRVLAAALPFLPEGTAILAEDAMRGDLLDAFAGEIRPLAAWDDSADFAPVAALPEGVRSRMLRLRAPAGRILGGNRAAGEDSGRMLDILILADGEEADA